MTGFPHVYRVRMTSLGLPSLEGRFGQRCRLLVRGALNSRLIEFEDGYQAVVRGGSFRRAR